MAFFVAAFSVLHLANRQFARRVVRVEMCGGWRRAGASLRSLETARPCQRQTRVAKGRRGRVARGTRHPGSLQPDSAAASRTRSSHLARPPGPWQAREWRHPPHLSANPSLSLCSHTRAARTRSSRSCIVSACAAAGAALEPGTHGTRRKGVPLQRAITRSNLPRRQVGPPRRPWWAGC